MINVIQISILYFISIAYDKITHHGYSVYFTLQIKIGVRSKNGIDASQTWAAKQTRFFMTFYDTINLGANNTTQYSKRH